MAATIGFLAAVFVVGVVLLVPRRTRATGGLTLLFAGLVLGLVTGWTLGPTDEPSPIGSGEITQASRTPAPQLQGFVTLTGAVTATELHADGDCDATRDLHIESLVVLAPWPDRSDAFIRLTPGRDSSDISVDLAHGTIQEGTTADATVTEQRSEAGDITSRSMTGSFDLSVGRVDVYAEWFCPNDIPKS